MNMQDVIATFGSMEKARERIEDICEHTDDEVEAIVGLALLGLDSLAAADPEREAKVEGAGEQRESANLRRQVDQALTLLYDNLDECPEGLVPAVKHALDCIQGATGMVVQLNQENKKLRGDTERGAREGE